jgi:hypothetical protein
VQLRHTSVLRTYYSASICQHDAVKVQRWRHVRRAHLTEVSGANTTRTQRAQLEQTRFAESPLYSRGIRTVACTSKGKFDVADLQCSRSRRKHEPYSSSYVQATRELSLASQLEVDLSSTSVGFDRGEGTGIVEILTAMMKSSTVNSPRVCVYSSTSTC